MADDAATRCISCTRPRRAGDSCMCGTWAGVETVDLSERARALLPKMTDARAFALHLTAGMGHVEWNFYPRSFKWLADNGLVVRDEEGWARCEPLGRAVDALLNKKESHV